MCSIMSHARYNRELLGYRAQYAKRRPEACRTSSVGCAFDDARSVTASNFVISTPRAYYRGEAMSSCNRVLADAGRGGLLSVVGV